jgi:hypothetical protein
MENYIFACWFAATFVTSDSSYTGFAHSLYQITCQFSSALTVYAKNPSKPEALCNFRNMLIFHGEESLAPRPTPDLEDHTLPVISDCLSNIFPATLHSWRTSPFANCGRAMSQWQGTYMTYCRNGRLNLGHKNSVIYDFLTRKWQ